MANTPTPDFREIAQEMNTASPVSITQARWRKLFARVFDWFDYQLWKIPALLGNGTPEDARRLLGLEHVTIAYEYRGNWQPDADYSTNDLVWWEGSTYGAIVSHHSSNDFKSDLDAGLWRAVGGDLATQLGESSGAAHVGFIQEGHGAVAYDLLQKARQRVTPEDFAARGDGMTDDSGAFLTAEASEHPVIELTRGRTYVVNGVQLRKRYMGFGTIMLDGVSHRIDPFHSVPSFSRSPLLFEDFPTLGGQPGKGPARYGHSVERPWDSREAVVVFVDPAKGNDSNPGTQAAPLKTFAAAMKRVPYMLFYGATIYLLDGFYAEPMVVSHIFMTASRWSTFQVIGHTPNNPAYSDYKPQNVVFDPRTPDGSNPPSSWSCIYGGPYNTNVEGVTLRAFWPYDVSCSMNYCILRGGGGAFGNYTIGGHGGRVHFSHVSFRDLPADGLCAEATDKAWFDFQECDIDGSVLAPIVSVKNGSIVSFKRCGFDLSTSYCEPGTFMMGDQSTYITQYGLGLASKSDGVISVSAGPVGGDGYNEGGLLTLHGKNEPLDAGTAAVIFGSREVDLPNAKFRVGYSDTTRKPHDVFEVLYNGIARAFTGFQMLPVQQSATVGFGGVLFVDAADNQLKFRSSSGVVKTVNLT